MPSPSSSRISPFKAILVIVGLLIIIALIQKDESKQRLPFETLSSGGIASPLATDMAMPEGLRAEKSMIAPSPLPPIVPGASREDRQRIGSKIIRHGSLNIRVRNTEETLGQIKTLAEAQGGFVADSNVNAYNDTKTGNITLRIPSNKFDETVRAVKALGTATLEASTQAEDVTDQFVDLEARLRSAKAEEEQYLNILRQAKSIEDTLNVTNRLADVRARIEQLQGQMRLMTDRTDYATLRVTLTEAANLGTSPTRGWSPRETLRQAIHDLVKSLQGVISSLITALVFLVGLLLPLGLIIALLAWSGMRVWKKMIK